MSLFTQTNLSPGDYILKHSLLYLGMRKTPDDKIKAIKNTDGYEETLKKFLDERGQCLFLFVVPTGAEALKLQVEPPTGDAIKRKVLLCLRVRQPPSGEVVCIDESNVNEEVIFMELNKNSLENLFLLCNEVYLPVLGNPLNVMDMSELVSKDLMDRFHVFLAHTYVTIGQVKGRTQLPLPPNDVTSSEKTSSKDKGSLLEQAIAHWTKQIKNVLKQDPESALKGGQHPDPLVELAFW